MRAPDHEPKETILSDEPKAAQLTAASQSWTRRLAPYRQRNLLRSIFEIAITVVPFGGLWFVAWAVLDYGYWLSLMLAVPAAGFLVRLFMIQHDCGHGTLFRHRLTNDWIGRAIGVLTLTPYDLWRRSHGTHHATTGNLDRRGIGDINTLTVREYQSRSYWGRLSYRLYRHPMVMFVFGPAHLFVLQHRLPFGYMRKGWGPWISTMGTNGVIVAVIAILVSLMGFKAFLLVHLPIMLLAASVGVWLFYVQHQFEHTSWETAASWNLQEAALHGSSHYDLPGILRWFTANIGMHHVHHLCSQIPYYRLPRAFRDHPELKHVGRLTLTESFRCVWLTLWDENRKRLVSFGEAGLKA